MGIEPTYQAWEARVLPLNYARVGLAVRLDTRQCERFVNLSSVAGGWGWVALCRFGKAVPVGFHDSGGCSGPRSAAQQDGARKACAGTGPRALMTWLEPAQARAFLPKNHIAAGNARISPYRIAPTFGASSTITRPLTSPNAHACRQEKADLPSGRSHHRGHKGRKDGHRHGR